MENIVFFRNGQVIMVSPPIAGSYYDNRDIINNAARINSDGLFYDLTDRRSIYSIKIPAYKDIPDNRVSADLGTTGFLEYVLRMHAGGLWNEGNYSLAMACLEKATQLMLYSTMRWPEKDFYRVVDWYIELGRFEKAKEWEEWILANVQPAEEYPLANFRKTLSDCDDMRTNLVEVVANSPCCAVCGKYRNRIYRISGLGGKYPKFPKDFCFKCGLSVYPFVEGVSEPTFNCISKVAHSHRPFVDDRTAEEKRRYEDWQESMEEMRQKEQTAKENRLAFYWLKKHFPELLPKSLPAFSRTRNSNSAKYQALVESVEAAGLFIPLTLDEAIDAEKAL